MRGPRSVILAAARFMYRYTYDYRNRLVLVGSKTTGGYSDVAAYAYDPQNRRIYKKAFDPAKETAYLYDGWQVLEERDKSGETWQVNRQFVYGARYIDEPLLFDINEDPETDNDCTEAGDTRYLYCQNANWNVMALTDIHGAPVERYIYDPYGVCTVTLDNASGNPYRFQGRRYDTESGLYYFRNRWYSPKLGRFLQRDPKGYVDGFNVFQVVRSAPTKLQDPLGLISTANLDRLVPLKFCGPDVTSWFKIELRFNARHEVIQNLALYHSLSGSHEGPPVAGQVLVAEDPTISTAGDAQLTYETMLVAAYFDFRDLVQRGGKWDFATTIAFTSKCCPTSPECHRTVTLCGFCVEASTLGNIHYGFVGTAGGIPASTLFEQAARLESGGVDPEHAKAEIQLGIDLWKGQKAVGPALGADVARLCNLVKARRARLRNTARTDTCVPCEERYGSK